MNILSDASRSISDASRGDTMTILLTIINATFLIMHFTYNGSYL